MKRTIFSLLVALMLVASANAFGSIHPSYAIDNKNLNEIVKDNPQFDEKAKKIEEIKIKDIKYNAKNDCWLIIVVITRTTIQISGDEIIVISISEIHYLLICNQ